MTHTGGCNLFTHQSLLSAETDPFRLDSQFECSRTYSHQYHDLETPRERGSLPVHIDGEFAELRDAVLDGGVGAEQPGEFGLADLGGQQRAGALGLPEVRETKLSRLFRTHPAVENRVAKLREQAVDMDA